MLFSQKIILIYEQDYILNNKNSLLFNLLIKYKREKIKKIIIKIWEYLTVKNHFQ